MKMMDSLHLLIPKRAGPEMESRVLFSKLAISTAFAGTGFDSENTWHSGVAGGIGPWVNGSDGLRYAIAIQQFRDAKDWGSADAARKTVEWFGIRVECGAGFTRCYEGDEREMKRWQ